MALAGWNKGRKRQPDGSLAYPPKVPAKPLVCDCGQPAQFVYAPKERGGKCEKRCEACDAAMQLNT